MASIRSLFKSWERRANPLAGLDADAWLTHVRDARPQALAVVEPNWRGVYSSTTHLFPHHLKVRDGLSRRSAGKVARLIAASAVPRIVIGGFPRTYVHLVEALHHACPRVEAYTLWHGSFLQSGERSGWESFTTAKRLTAEGRIKKLGFVKSGMAEVLARLGIPTGFVLAAVDKCPAAPAKPLPGGPHLGLWAVDLSLWRKLPYAMLAAATEVPGAMVHMSGVDDRVARFIRELGIPAKVNKGPVPQDEMPERLRAMHLNLYVTLSECCPMLPMESLAEGTPCLLGPNSHLFEDDPYLHSRLVVPYPDRNEVIARFIRRALEERDVIVAAYARWLPGYVERSRQSVATFLDLGPAAAVAQSAAA